MTPKTFNEHWINEGNDQALHALRSNALGAWQASQDAGNSVNADLLKALKHLVGRVDQHRRVYGQEKAHYIIDENPAWKDARLAIAAAEAQS